MKPIRSSTTAALALALAFSAAFDCVAQVKDHEKIKYPDLNPFVVPQPKTVELDNGMVVMLLEDHELPLVELRARIRTGSRLVPAEKTGLADIYGEVLRTGGTKRMTGDAIDDFLEARAAEIETGIGVDSGFLYASSLTQDIPEILDLAASILREPAFAEDKITIAKNQVNAVIARRNDDPDGILDREFDKIIYGAESPYALTPEYATIAAITRDDLIAFHEKYVHPNRIILGVAGDFDSEEMTRRLRETFGSWPAGPAVSDPEVSFKGEPRAGVYHVEKQDMTQSNIMMGHVGIRRDNPDFFAVRVLNEAFGGAQVARLFNNIRSKKGLAYHVGGGIGYEYDRPGVFAAIMKTKVETTAAGIDALLEEIDAIVKKPPTAEEVRRAKESILNSFVFNFDSTLEILDQQMTLQYFGYPADYLATYRSKIEKVTPQDVARVAEKYIHKADLTILVVGPSEGRDRPLDSFGPVSAVDITIPEPAAPEIPAATPESMASGRALFARMIDAMGGRDRVGSVSSLRTVFSSARRMGPAEMSLKVVSTQSLPDRIHLKIDAPMGTFVIVLNADDGFLVMPGQGAGPLPQSQHDEMTASVWRQPINLARRIDDPEVIFQHLGTETIDGTELEALLVSVEGDSMRLFIEPETGQLVRQSYHGQNEQGPGEFVASYSDYRDVEGLSFPFRTVMTFNGDTMETRVIEEIAINPAVDASLFVRPEGEEAQAGG